MKILGRVIGRKPEPQNPPSRYIKTYTRSYPPRRDDIEVEATTDDAILAATDLGMDIASLVAYQIAIQNQQDTSPMPNCDSSPPTASSDYSSPSCDTSSSSSNYDSNSSSYDSGSSY